MTDAKYKGERRPIASREKAVSKLLAGGLVRLGVSPNAISVAGMIAGILAGVALGATPHVDSAIAQRLLFAAGAVLIQLRLLANMLDGMVAVQTGVASPVGELYNEVPDRVSDAAILIGAGYALGGLPEVGFAAACLAIFVAYIRAQGKAAGAHHEFCGPLAKPQRMFFMTALCLYCAAAPLAWLPHHVAGGWGVMAWGMVALSVGVVVTCLRRLGKIAAALKRRTT